MAVVTLYSLVAFVRIVANMAVIAPALQRNIENWLNVAIATGYGRMGAEKQVPGIRIVIEQGG